MFRISALQLSSFCYAVFLMSFHCVWHIILETMEERKAEKWTLRGS